jgi:hypothetical protein
MMLSAKRTESVVGLNAPVTGAHPGAPVSGAAVSGANASVALSSKRASCAGVEESTAEASAVPTSRFALSSVVPGESDKSAPAPSSEAFVVASDETPPLPSPPAFELPAPHPHASAERTAIDACARSRRLVAIILTSFAC